ncbi:MAG: PadR family transcriptional regulator [Candidatus Promineifilaceae bacterium]|nr:PadR family transcriptional regulator [Candidatus Promineifilaceae bacterium]
MERELLLLGLLKREQMHGYQLHEFIDSYMQTCVDIKKPTAYYLLDKMERQGLITRKEEKKGNRPTRRVYSMTTAGEERFQHLLRRNLATYQQNLYPNNTGFIFLQELPLDEAVALLLQRRQLIRARLQEAKGAPHHPSGMQYMIDHQITMLQAELTWLEGVIERLQAE